MGKIMVSFFVFFVVILGIIIHKLM
jgi:hypothetical protein